MDDEPVVRTFAMFSPWHVPLRVLGGLEPHEVRIENTRKALMGGFRAQERVTYVDGQEIGCYSTAL